MTEFENHGHHPRDEKEIISRPDEIIAASDNQVEIPDSKVPYQKMSRREFLTGMLVLGTGAVVAAKKIPPLYEQANGLLDTDESVATVNNTIKYIQERYGNIKFYNGPSFPIINAILTGSIIEGEALIDSELKNALALVQNEIVKYPLDYFSRNGIESIRFTNRLRSNGRHVGGYANLLVGQIGLDFENSTNPADNEYIRGAFHHELFHLADFHDNGYSADDQKWIDIHRCTCQVYEKVQGSDSLSERVTSPAEWFLRSYSRVKPSEDRADFASWLLIKDRHRNLLQLIDNTENPETQRILRAKYQDMKDSYLRLSNGKMNDQYWRDLLKGRVGADYFS